MFLLNKDEPIYVLVLFECHKVFRLYQCLQEYFVCKISTGF